MSSGMNMESRSGKDGQEDAAARFFDCTDAQRASFEAGIKLGGLFHQFVGTPLSATNVEALEDAIRRSVAVQPFVEDVRVRITCRPHPRESEYDYTTLSGEMLDARIVVRYGGARVRCAMRFVEELDYPLMYVESVVMAGCEKAGNEVAGCEKAVNETDNDE